MGGGFPTAPQSRATGEAGINHVASVVNDEWGWVFRRNHNENDFGLDGFLDVILDDGTVTGQSVAVQVKCGDSYFKTQDALAVTFYGERKHLNYYMNCALPVLIVLFNPATKQCLWAHFRPEVTSPTNSGWKMSIPKANNFDLRARDAILKILGPAQDFSDALEPQWAFSRVLEDTNYVLYSVDRSLVELLDVELAHAFFDRLRSSEALARRMQGRIDLCFAGYDDDPRELWEIPEVRAWFRLADPLIRDWFFFLVPRGPFGPLKAYVSCMCDVEWLTDPDPNVPDANVVIDSGQMAKLFEANFLRLNELLDQLGMTIDDNKSICYAIYDVFGIPHEPWPAS